MDACENDDGVVRKGDPVPSPPPIATPPRAQITGIQASQPQSRGKEPSPGLDSPRSIKRGFNLTEIALAVGSIMMTAGVLWYFIG